MKRIILMLAVALATSQAFGQCACCAGAGIGSSNGDYNNGILTLEKNKWLAEVYGDYRTIKDGHEHMHEEMVMEEDMHEETPLKSMFITSAGVRYGLSNSITISALIPYVFLHTDTGNDQGLGDLMLMGTFKIVSKNNFNFALQAGLELPTGEQKNSNFDNTTVVVGSGSYDPIFGAAFSQKWNKFMLNGSGLYKHTTKGFEDNYYASIAVQNLSLSYKLLGGNTPAPTEGMEVTKPSNTSLGVFAGYYGEWVDKLEEDGIVDENSGYYLGFANVGANLSYNKWIFPLTVSLPFINNVNGEQNEAGVRLRLGVIRYF